MSMHQFIKLNCLNYQANPPDLQVGKLSYLKNCVGIEIQNTATHELGHALGLAHSRKNNIMYTAQTRQILLGSDDKDSYDEAYKKY